MSQIAVVGFCHPEGGADSVVDGDFPGRPAPDALVDTVFLVIGELRSIPPEQLDAVVRGRVVRGGNHHAQCRTGIGGEEGDAAGGQYAHVDRIDADRLKAGLERAREHLTGSPGVPADENLPARDEFACGAADGHCEVRRQFDIGAAADPIGSKEPAAFCREHP